MTFHLRDGEALIFHARANLYRGIEGVGGDLRLTNRRILFHPHLLNISKEPEEIEYRDIKEVVLKNTLGVFPNGINIQLKNGKSLHFVVFDREKILELIKRHMSEMGNE